MISGLTKKMLNTLIAACKKSAQFMNSFLRYIQQIIESHDLKGHPMFHHVCAITIKVTFSSLKYVQHAKNCPGSFMHLEIRVPCTFYTTTTQKLLTL